MSHALDRASGDHAASSDKPSQDDGSGAEGVDIRDGVRRAHAVALTGREIARVVDGTVLMADEVLRAARIATAAGNFDCAPSSIPANPPAKILVAVAERSHGREIEIVPIGRVIDESAEPRALTPARLGLAVATSAVIAVFVAGYPLRIGPVTSEPPEATASVTPRVAEAALAPVPAPPAVAVPAPQLSILSTGIGVDDDALRLGLAVRTLRLEWARAGTDAAPPAPPPPAVTAVSVGTRPPEIPGFTPRKLDAEEIAGLIKRGQDFFASGDVAAARLMLQRAAEAADPRAALALAATYDPIVLQDLGVRGAVPDLAMARAWYEKARIFGSTDAPHRLELLASRAQ